MADLDYLLDDNYGRTIANGDWVIGNARDQRVQLILASSPGDWKQWPLLGAGLVNFLNGPFDATRRKSMIRRISLQLEYDGLQLNEVDFHDGDLIVTVV